MSASSALERRKGGGVIRFGPFTIDPENESLECEGVSVSIQHQPLEVLSYLASRGERVVSREEICDHIWGDTFVERDKGLNFCIHEIRQALGDSFRNPRYIRTVPRKGYQFIAPVRFARNGQSERDSAGGSSRRRSLYFWATAAAFVLMAGVTTASLRNHRGTLQPVELRTAVPEAAELYRQGNIYFQRNLKYRDLESAAESFGRAVELDSTFGQAWAKLSIARASLFFEFNLAQQLQPAREAADRARALEPDSPETLLALGYLSYYGERDYDAALRMMDAALEARPGDPDVLTARGFVLRRVGRWDEALESFYAAIPHASGSYDLTLAIATTLQTMRDFDVAEQYYDRAFALDPHLHSSPFFKATMEVERTGDGAAGLEAMSRWRGFRPEYVLVSRELSRAAAGALDVERLNPARVGIDSLVAYYNLGNVFDARGEPERALAMFDSARTVGEGRSMHEQDVEEIVGLGGRHMYLAYAYARLGLKRQALDLAHRIADRQMVIDDRYSGTIIRVLLAEVSAAAGENGVAINLLADLIERPARLTRRQLKTDQVWDPLRGDPRFLRLIEGHSG